MIFVSDLQWIQNEIEQPRWDDTPDRDIILLFGLIFRKGAVPYYSHVWLVCGLFSKHLRKYCQRGGVMEILSVYFPTLKPVIIWFAILLAAFVTLCGIAKHLKLSLPVTLVLMSIGVGIAIGPQLIQCLNVEPGSFEYARAFGSPDYNDSVLAIMAYMDAGWGSLFAILGMTGGVIAQAVLHRLAAKQLNTDEVRNVPGKSKFS